MFKRLVALEDALAASTKSQQNSLSAILAQLTKTSELQEGISSGQNLSSLGERPEHSAVEPADISTGSTVGNAPRLGPLSAKEQMAAKRAARKSTEASPPRASSSPQTGSVRRPGSRELNPAGRIRGRGLSPAGAINVCLLRT
eukprot:SAG31_NODE_888_length_11219_cov_5.584712_12_plen_143_part_00